MWNELGFSWWVFALIVVLFVLGVWALFRSFRKWKQPPPGNDPEAREAELRLRAMSKRTGGSWGG